MQVFIELTGCFWLLWASICLRWEGGGGGGVPVLRNSHFLLVLNDPIAAPTKDWRGGGCLFLKFALGDLDLDPQQKMEGGDTYFFLNVLCDPQYLDHKKKPVARGIWQA